MSGPGIIGEKLIGPLFLYDPVDTYLLFLKVELLLLHESLPFIFINEISIYSNRSLSW